MRGLPQKWRILSAKVGKKLDQARVAPFNEKRLAEYASVAADGRLSYYLDYTLNGPGPAVARENEGL